MEFFSAEFPSDEGLYLFLLSSDFEYRSISTHNNTPGDMPGSPSLRHFDLLGSILGLLIYAFEDIGMRMISL